MYNKYLFLLILFCSLLLFVFALTTKLSLGDEVYHYRFAKDIFNAGQRVAFDPLYGSGNPPGYYYNTDPLWHLLLAFIWKIFGKISFPIAQVYHTLYYSFLIFFTYLLGKYLYGAKNGFYSAVIIATVPVVVAFSVLFYLDVPATTLTTLCFVLIIRKNFFWSGVTLGLMYLTKRSTLFFVPAFLFFALFSGDISLRRKVVNCSNLILPAILLILSDLIWREYNLKTRGILISNDGKIMLGPLIGNLEAIKNRFTVINWKLKLSEYLNSSIINPRDIITYFGFILITAIILYILLKVFSKKDLTLWFPIICFFLCFCYVFSPVSDIRYLLPVFPLLSVLSAKVFEKLSYKKWLKILFISICTLQFFATASFITKKRMIPKGVSDAFIFLKKTSGPNSLIIYPEYTLLEATNRRFVWAGTAYDVFKNLFWNNDKKTVKNLLESMHVDYIVIKKARIYDDAKIRHFGGYPKSFVESLPEIPFLKLVFDNKEISIWKMN